MKCANGHALAEVGTDNRGCCMRCRQAQRKRYAKQRAKQVRDGTYRARLRKPYCPYGHDKREVGVSLNGRCRECAEEQKRDYERRRSRRKAKGNPRSLLWSTRLVPNLLSFGERLEALRLSHGLNASEFGKLAGLDRTHVRKIERGLLRPTPATVEKLLRTVKELQTREAYRVRSVNEALGAEA